MFGNPALGPNGKATVLQNVTGTNGLLSQKKKGGMLTGATPQMAYTPVMPGMIDQMASQLAYGGFGTAPENTDFLNNLYGQTPDHRAYGQDATASQQPDSPAAPQGSGLAEYWAKVGHNPADESWIRQRYPDFARAYDSGVYHSHGYKGIRADGSGLGPGRPQASVSIGVGR